MPFVCVCMLACAQNKFDAQELEELRELRGDIERKDKQQAGIIEHQVCVCVRVCMRACFCLYMCACVLTCDCAQL